MSEITIESPAAAPAAAQTADIVPAGVANLVTERPLEIAIRESHVEPEIATSIRKSFAALFDQAEDWAAKAKTINITDASQTREMKLARETRLAIKEIRLKGQKAHKLLKEDILRRGRAIDGAKNMLEFLLEPIEENLMAQEKFVENKEKERKEKLRIERADKLTTLGADPGLYMLGEMEQEQFDRVVAMLATAAEEKAKMEREAEAARIKAEADAAAEKERIRLENERLQREAAEAKAAAEVAEKARLAAEETARKDKEAQDELLRQERAESARRAAEAAEKARAEREEIERQAAERERLAKAAAEVEQRRIREEAEAKNQRDQAALAAKLAAEQAEKDRVAEENRQKQAEIDRKAREKADKEAADRAKAQKAEYERLTREQEKLAAERKDAEIKAAAATKVEKERIEAEADQIRAAQSAPDREKFIVLANMVRGIEMPKMTSSDGISAIMAVQTRFADLAGWIDRKRVDVFGADPAPLTPASTPQQGKLL